METQVLKQDRRNKSGKLIASASNTPLIATRDDHDDRNNQIYSNNNTNEQSAISIVVQGSGNGIDNTPTTNTASVTHQSLMLDSFKQRDHREDALKMGFVVAGFAIMSTLAIWV